MFVADKPFQASNICEYCRSLPKCGPLKWPTLGRLLALSANIKLDWNGLAGTNALDYFLQRQSLRIQKSFYNIGTKCALYVGVGLFHRGALNNVVSTLICYIRPSLLPQEKLIKEDSCARVIRIFIRLKNGSLSFLFLGVIYTINFLLQWQVKLLIKIVYLSLSPWLIFSNKARAYPKETTWVGSQPRPLILDQDESDWWRLTT